MYRSDEAQPVLLITSSYLMRHSVENALRRTNFAVRHIPFATAEQVGQCGSIVICAPETDWRCYVDSMTVGDDNMPPVILLMTTADPEMWAAAVQSGRIRCCPDHCPA